MPRAGMPIAGLAPDRSPVGAMSSVLSAIMLFLRARALGSAGECRAAHAGVAARRGGIRDQGSAGVQRAVGRELAFEFLVRAATRTGEVPHWVREGLALRVNGRMLLAYPDESYEEWGQILGDEVMAAALIDRLLHHCHIVNIRGSSYRMRKHTDLSKILHSPPAESSPSPPKRKRARAKEKTTN